MFARLCMSLLFFVAVEILATPSENILSFTKDNLSRKKRSLDASETSFANTREKRDAQCSTNPELDKIEKSIHTFRNDENPAISLTWSGKNGVILALTTMNYGIVMHRSRLYRSTNRGKTFVDISSQIANSTIRKTSGVHLSPVDSSKVILVVYVSPFTSRPETPIYITTDAGGSFQRAVCPFILDPTSLTFNPTNQYSLLAKSTDNRLYMSTDFGRQWTLIKHNVHSGKWDPIVNNLFYYTFDPSGRMSTTSTENELYKQMTTENTGDLIAQHVHSFAVQNDFLFLSVQFPGNNGSRVMHISKDQGNTWNAAQLPLINPDQFYSILDMSEGMVFVHVDLPGDTGHGSIYTSEERGIVYSKSLDRHLYPNTRGITDFYKVKSLPGVYITSQLTVDNTVHSKITFDKGGAWESLTPPDGSTCLPTERECKLQVHNYFSASKHVSLPALPLSSESAVGIIMAHGNLGDGLNFNPPQVFITSDGGYSWKQPSQLKGPHYYGIGDSGGILFAVPATTETIKTMMFSFDEGNCWHNYNFTDKPIRVTGISAEPGEKATDVSIWGWDQNGDGSWIAITVNLGPAMGGVCSNSDYRTWTAHETNKLNDDGCLLGEQKKYIRRKAGTLCINGDNNGPTPVVKTCLCQQTDYICDYGYKRDETTLKCVRDALAATSHMDICIDNDEETIQTKGYRKIPGDNCQGGFVPTRNVEDLRKSCAKVQVVDEHYGVDPNSFVDYSTPHTSPHIGLILFLVIAILVLGASLGVLLYRKRHSVLKVRYTPLSQDDNAEQANGAAVSALVGTTTVVDDDDDAVIINPDSFGNGKPKNGGTLSYHDDSDEDLLVT